MQNHPKPNLKLILRPKEDFRDIFQPGQPGWPGPCNQPLSVLKLLPRCVEVIASCSLAENLPRQSSKLANDVGNYFDCGRQLVNVFICFIIA
jgi:hypothetical protein